MEQIWTTFFQTKKKRAPAPLVLSCSVCGAPAPEHLHFGGKCFHFGGFFIIVALFSFRKYFYIIETTFSSLFKYFYYFFFSEAFFTIEIFFITVKFFTILTIMRPICLRYFSLLLRLWRNYFEIKTICNEMAGIISFSLADQF